MKDKKIKLILLLSVALLIPFLIFFYYKSSNNPLQDYQTEEALLIPDSEEDYGFSNKTSAYEADKKEKLVNKRETERSYQYKESDFFLDVAKSPEDGTGSSYNEDLPSNQTAEELYEETIIKKTNKGGSSSYREYGKKDRVTEMYEEADKSYKNNMRKKDSLLNVALEAKKEQENLYNSGIKENDSGNRIRGGSRTSMSSTILVSACIHGKQTVTNGSSVTMRLLEDLKIDDVTFPKNCLLYGTASFSKERLNIKIENLKYGKKVKFVQFEVYDIDVIKGLNLSENTKNELAKKSSQGIIDGVNIPTTGTGIVGSAISSTVSAVKSVARKEINEVSTDLKANYNIYIKQF